MATATIPRMKFSQVEGSLASERVQLAKDAEEQFGYKKLAMAIAAPGALLFSLRELSIEPLQTHKVFAYMRRKVKTGVYSGTKMGIAFLLGIPFSVAAIATIANSMQGKVWPGWMYGLLAISIGASVASVIGSLWCGIEGKWHAGHRRVIYWDKVAIADYQGNIPEFALSKALEIKREVPDAEFGIYRLVSRTEETKPIPLRDPFLFVRKGNEMYYIEVWDEQEYEAKL
jgi:hypothetical protein